MRRKGHVHHSESIHVMAERRRQYSVAYRRASQGATRADESTAARQERSAGSTRQRERVYNASSTEQKTTSASPEHTVCHKDVQKSTTFDQFKLFFQDTVNWTLTQT